MNKAEPLSLTILILHPGSLGDVLLALPTIRALRAAFPTHEIGLVAASGVGGLLLAGKEIDRLFPLEHRVLADLMAGAAQAAPALRSWLGRCALALGWLADPDGVLRSTLIELGAGRVILRSPFSVLCRAVHQADRLLETVADLVAPGKYDGALNLPSALVAEGEARMAALRSGAPGPVVAIHPGSGARYKCAEPTLFAHLVEWCQARGCIPMVVGGPADEEAAAAVAAGCRTGPVILQGRDLLTMAGALANAALFVGHDSGLTHLAATLHVPTLALFGPTAISRWAPRGRHVTVLTGGACRCEGEAAVSSCRERPCLRVPLDRLTIACEPWVDQARHTRWASASGGPSPCHVQ
jgi:ADP-heptose:LPS heptosyltransferase